MGRSPSAFDASENSSRNGLEPAGLSAEGDDVRPVAVFGKASSYLRAMVVRVKFGR